MSEIILDSKALYEHLRKEFVKLGGTYLKAINLQTIKLTVMDPSLIAPLPMAVKQKLVVLIC